MALISIHPPRVGRDGNVNVVDVDRHNFNPPSPCGEGLALGGGGHTGVGISIHPPRVGRDWVKWDKPSACSSDFNPPSPCGEGLDRGLRALQVCAISIHPPRVGRDFDVFCCCSASLISIHPPRVGRDSTRDFMPETADYFNPPSPCGEGPVWTLTRPPLTPNFNPPSPCGEGPPWVVAETPGLVFQSTLPVWGGTCATCGRKGGRGISIHPPRVGRD